MSAQVNGSDQVAAMVAVVTGSSRGIGLATALALAQAGYVVVATMRDPTRAADLLRAANAGGVRVDPQPLDVTDDDSVTSCVGEILDRYGRIDVLVNNAGALYSGTLEELSINDVRDSLDVNFLGVARVTKAVLPAMRRARCGHIIAVSSISGAFGQPFNDAYCAAKFAVEGLYEALSPVAGSFGVHISLVEPGPVNGQFVQDGKGVAVRDPDGPFAPLWERFDAIATGSYKYAQAPEAIADLIVAIAGDPAARLRYQTSRSGERTVAIKMADVTGDRVTSMTRSWLS